MSVSTRPGAQPDAAGDAESFVTGLRARGSVIRLYSGGQAHVTIRVEVPEVWDVVRVEAPLTASVRDVKVRTLAVLYPDYGDADAFVMKLHGAEVRDESASIGAIGAVEGSIFLLTHRRRQPVKR